MILIKHMKICQRALYSSYILVIAEAQTAHPDHSKDAR